MTEFDCVIIADGCLSPAAERQLSRLLDAHHHAQIRTGVLCLRGDRMDLGWPSDKDITRRFDGGTIARIDPDITCSAPLTLVVSLALAFIEPTTPLRLFTEQVVIWPFEPSMVLPVDEKTGEQRSLADQTPGMARTIAARLNAPAIWAPRTAGERHDLMQHAIGLAVTDWVWWPILEDGRERRRVEKCMVGRHWLGDEPLDPAAYGEFAEAFGDCWPMDLAFHGKPAVLKNLPRLDHRQGMKLVDDEEQPLEDFLSGLALFVAVGDRQAAAHVPFAMFEAMQAGVVVIATPAISAIIDSPLPHAEPPELMGLATSFLGDDIACERARRRQQQLIAERHSAKAHRTRISPYLTRKAPVAPSPSIIARGGNRVLFVSDDSPHLEHLTRELAIAEHLSAALKPHFATTARNARLVEQRGFPVDFVSAHNSLPYRQIFDDASRWNYWFERHLAELIAFTKARALVFDGVYPFGGVMANRKRFPNLHFVWIRQQLWHPKANRDALRHSTEFDLVIEPGDLAAGFDRGPLMPLRHQVLGTPPVRLDEPMPRAEARQALGLTDDAPPVFLVDPTLPADKVDGETVSMLLNSLEQSGASLWAIDPGSASFSPSWSRQVKRLEGLAAGRLRSAFDGAITAADYRSLHDNAAAGLPAILLSGLGSSTDDQAARAAFAEAAGFAVSLRSGDIYGARAAARQMLDPACRAIMTAALGRQETENGADMAALAIADLVFSVPIPKRAGTPHRTRTN